ncbi:TPA: hypothetical protein G8C29_004305 [Salmonella enterica]|uniref:Uncharacterized protein n=1 Tax=Salmonella enterica TaxID=28901 RepID=A0A749C110_SALER|nr:hypothetical protein [Salmonella enterica]
MTSLPLPQQGQSCLATYATMLICSYCEPANDKREPVRINASSLAVNVSRKNG